MFDLSDISAFATILQTMGSANPLKAMERPRDAYSACWCLSGKKWKFCHKDRDKQKSLAIGQRQARLLSEFRTGTCLHPLASSESCSDSAKPIRSHTVQRRGGLASIAEKGHVYSTKKGVVEIAKNDGGVAPKLIGVADASTFPGFCSRHDTDMFKPGEKNDSKLDRWNAFLLSFRAVAYELATKEATLRAFPAMRMDDDRGRPYQTQVEIQTYLFFLEDGIRKGMRDVSRWKGEYDTAYLHQDLSNFRLYGVTFEDALPFVASGAFMPEYDFTGNKLQALGDGRPTDHVVLNVTVLGDKTVAALGWMGSQDGAAAQFVASFASLPDSQKPDGLMLMAFEYLENLYLKPSWWDSISPETKTVLLSKVADGMFHRSASALVEPDLRILSASLAEILDERSVVDSESAQ